MDAHADPRPLTGEPIALDLVNTRWRGADGPHDLLATLEGVATWLAGVGLGDRARADAATRDALLAARDALAGVLAAPGDPAAAAALDAVLARGRVRRSLTAAGPEDRVEVDPADLAAWTAADGYLDLLRRDPARIRRCAHPDCVLHFYDTSKNGTRRWCSMAGCGNRAKAARHYARQTR
jgi:predicted RNA-binding Zn ribbon-like protein